MGTEFFEVNGVRVANIKNDSGIAVFAISVLAGSNYEWPNVAGISHFGEHMFFKGTESRNWRQINESFAKLGVNNNAYTSNNDVLYHTTSPKENIPHVIDLMMDMFFNSTIPEVELEKERGVITEEKQGRDDDPKSAFDAACCANFFQWEIGHDIVGTFDTIANISRDDMVHYLEKQTNLANFMFVCSGDIDSDDLKRYIERNLPSEHPYLRPGSLNTRGCDLWIPSSRLPSSLQGDSKIKFLYERENITQTSISMLTEGIPLTDDLHFAERVASYAIGGGMYSKLFSRLREELGLCYNTGMMGYSIGYPDLVVNELYGYTSPENVEEYIDEAENVLNDVLSNGVDEDLFECAKTDLVAKTLMGTETSRGKMSYLSKRYLIGREGSLDDVMSDLRKVTRDDVNEVVKKWLAQDYTWAVMLPKGD